MFELAFSEVLLVLIIALVVIGPERLPEVARGLGTMVGKTRRFIDNLRNEASLHEEIAELRRQLDLSREAAQLQQLGQSIKSDIQSSINEIDYTIYNRPSSDDIRRQHTASATGTEPAGSAAPKAPEDDDLAQVQRPTFGRERYEELPPWYHQQSDGAMTPKVPTPPQWPTPAPTLAESAPSVTESRPKA